MKNCRNCGADITDQPTKTIRCLDCHTEVLKERNRLNSVIQRAKDPEKSREYMREAQKKWVAANLEKARAKSRNYYAENPEYRERSIERNKLYREENKERIAEQRKAWEIENKDRIRANARRRYLENVEKHKEYNAEYYAKNREELKLKRLAKKDLED